jgi:cytochrome d ubiquinol oxidase subunit I
MQHPVGYVINQGRAELASFWEVVTNPFAILTFLHVVIAGCIVGGFFVMGVSAYHLLKKNHLSMFRKSFRLALIFSLVFSVSELAIGDFHGKEVAQKQPAKVAALESIWETASGVPFALLTLPDEKNERNYFEALKIPKFASFLLYGDWNAEIKGLKDFPRDERPPVLLTFVSFRLMVGLGFLFALWTVIGFFLRNKIEENRWYLWVTLFMIPLPYLASELGWIVTEVGRQPWIVYGMMKTSEAVSPIVSSQVAISLVAFIVLYTLLGFAAFFLMFDIARKGPNVPLPGEKLAQQER